MDFEQHYALNGGKLWRSKFKPRDRFLFTIAYDELQGYAASYADRSEKRGRAHVITSGLKSYESALQTCETVYNTLTGG